VGTAARDAARVLRDAGGQRAGAERDCGDERLPGAHGAPRDRRRVEAATQAEFIAAVEQIVDRKVVAFASGIDPDANTVFECFYFEPRASGSDGNGDGTLAA
jgi:hypothetical protein